MPNFYIPISLLSVNSEISASYSASLLVTLNSQRIDCWMMSLFDETRMGLTPLPFMLLELSIESIHFKDGHLERHNNSWSTCKSVLGVKFVMRAAST